MAPLTASPTTIIVFSALGGAGTFIAALFYMLRAFRNRTGPSLAGGGIKNFMMNYSGHFEMDMLPAFVNLVTAMQYCGETSEAIEGVDGFFNVYRWSSYMITCPLMVYEIAYSIGAPYRLTCMVLTFLTISTGCFADASASGVGKWSWFAMGGLMNVVLFAMLYKIWLHSKELNKKFSSDRSMKETMKAMNMNENNFPKGIVNFKTPMDEKMAYIDYAFYIMAFLWPVFPLMFILEASGAVDKEFMQVVFSVMDLVIKTTHSYALDQYKIGLRQTVFPYGFLDTAVLYELDVWAEDDIYAQLKGLSRAMYGDLLVGNKGMTDIGSAGLDYQTLLVANRVNKKIDNFTNEWSSEAESVDENNKDLSTEVGTASSTPTDTARTFDGRSVPSPGSSPRGSRQGSSRNHRSVAPEPDYNDYNEQVRSPTPTRGAPMAPSPRSVNRRASLSHFKTGSSTNINKVNQLQGNNNDKQQGPPQGQQQYGYDQQGQQQYGYDQQGQQQYGYDQRGKQQNGYDQQGQQQNGYGQQQGGLEQQGQQQQQQFGYGQQQGLPGHQQQNSYEQQQGRQQGQQQYGYGQQQGQQQNSFGQQNQHNSSPNLQQLSQSPPPQQVQVQKQPPQMHQMQQQSPQMQQQSPQMHQQQSPTAPQQAQFGLPRQQMPGSPQRPGGENNGPGGEPIIWH